MAAPPHPAAGAGAGVGAGAAPSPTKASGGTVAAAAASKPKTGGWDWTASYAAWEAWDDGEGDKAATTESGDASVAKNRAMMACNHDHSSERRVFEMPLRDKIRSCQEFKAIGNSFFADGQFYRAAEKYRMVLIYNEYCFPEDDADQAALDALRRDALLNLASCKLRTGQYPEVVDACTQVLTADSGNVKALYRRAQAHRLMDEFSAAAADIRAAIAAEPGLRMLRAEAAAIRSRSACYKKRRKSVSAAMFKRSQSGSGPGGDPPVSASVAVQPDQGVTAGLRRAAHLVPE